MIYPSALTLLRTRAAQDADEAITKPPNCVRTLLC